MKVALFIPCYVRAVAPSVIEASYKLLRHLGVDVAVSVTGIAGPGGAEPGKPVGTVWVGVSRDGKSFAEECHFEGDREAVREQTVCRALSMLVENL